MKEVVHYAGVFLATVSILFALLLLTALIPQEALQTHMEESAEYLIDTDEHFYNIINNFDCTKIDQYADSMLLNVAYNIDHEHPLESILWARYHFESANTRNADFHEAVFEEAEPNEQYLRYWHGSIVVVRLFHLIGNIKQLYVLHAIVLTLLFTWLEIVLCKNRMRLEALFIVISMLAVNLWVVPWCLEYTWMFIVMFVASIFTLNISFKSNYEKLPLLFMIIGIVAAYLDFLTTETLTFTIPFLLALRVRKHVTSDKQSSFEWKFLVLCGIMWLTGYAGMWALKWGISAGVLHENVIPYLKGNMDYHLGIGSHYSYFVLLLTGLMRNTICLFPQGYGYVGISTALILLFTGLLIPVVKDIIRLKSSIHWHNVLLYGAIGMIPFFRYAAIVRHMWWHFFFTYRAQAATVFALCFIIEELLEKNPEKEVKNRAQSKQTHITYRPHALPERRSKHRILH